MAHQSTRDEITELIETIDLLIPVADDKIKQYKELARSKDDLRLDELFNFSERLIAGRLRLGWSQAQLAQRMGVTRQNLTKYEATFYKGVTFGRMSQIAKILHEALRKVEHSQHS